MGRDFSWNRVLGVLGALALALALLGVLYVAGVPRQAEAESVNAWFLTTISDGSTSYTGTQNLGQSYVANYGEVEIQVTSDVSVTTSTLTIVPQFSNDTGTCSAASNWFTATNPVFYTSQTNAIVSSQVSTQTTTVVTNTSTITQEVGYIITSTTTTATPSLSQVNYSFTVTGDGTGALVVPIQGACMRVRLSVTNSDTYTPTIKARLVNRY